ncbi:MAG: hypothetical protein M3R66_03605 [Actinomycetota bacterium]|nr:hypothetical protein [Actinomycetota bacterium]
MTGEVTIHLSIPTTGDNAGSTGGVGAGLHDDAAQAEVNGQLIGAAQCPPAKTPSTRLDPRPAG